MKLKTYLKGKNDSDFSAEIGTTPNYLFQLKYNKRRRPSPALALKIEKATGGQVTVMELLFPEKPNETPVDQVTHGK